MFFERSLSDEDILAHNIYECSFKPPVEIALKVSQSILRCGDGLIHGRINMMRLLMCLMGMLNFIPYIFSTIYSKIQIWYLDFDTIIINDFDKYNDS